MKPLTKQQKLFFHLCMWPFLLEWIPWLVLAYADTRVMSESEWLFMLYAPVIICHRWVYRVIPVSSLYQKDYFFSFQIDEILDYWMYNFVELYYDVCIEKKELINRPLESGIRICVMEFVSLEIFLLLVPLRSMIMYFSGILFHLLSIYYFVLSLINVINRDTYQADVTAVRTVVALEDFNAKSRFGFLTSRAYRYKSYFFPYPFLWAITFLAGFFFVIYKRVSEAGVFWMAFF